MVRKIHKNLSFSQNPLNFLLQNLHWEIHIDSVQFHFQNWEF